MKCIRKYCRRYVPKGWKGSECARCRRRRNAGLPVYPYHTRYGVIGDPVDDPDQQHITEW